MLKLKFVYGVLPALVWYGENIADQKFGGFANGPLIRIRSKYVIDHGLLEHELTHVKQWWRTLGIHGILYAVSSKYRLASEVEAYRAQLRLCDPSAVEWMIKAIQTKYDLSVPEEKIRKLLTEA